MFASCSDMWRRLPPYSVPSRHSVAQTKVLRQDGQRLPRPFGLQPLGALTAAKLSELEASMASDLAAFEAPGFDFLDIERAREVQKRCGLLNRQLVVLLYQHHRALLGHHAEHVGK